MEGTTVIRPNAAWGAALGLVLSFSASGVTAAESHPLPPPGSLRIAEAPPFTPGQVVHLAWDPLPFDVEEFEILLAAEFPARLRVRLTESHEASRRGLSVTLPALPPCSARFLLRAGSPRGEFLFGQSEPWRLAAPARGHVQRLQERKGELWLSPAVPQAVRLDSSDPPRAEGPASPPPSPPSVRLRGLPAGFTAAAIRGKVYASPPPGRSPAVFAPPPAHPLRI